MFLQRYPTVPISFAPILDFAIASNRHAPGGLHRSSEHKEDRRGRFLRSEAN
jgi:hypothetical protein